MSIRVHVVDYNRQVLYMRYRDPATGKQVARSTGTASKKEAVRIAAKWEAELQAGRYKKAVKSAWGDFRERYDAEHVAGLSPRTAEKVDYVFDAVERIIAPQTLADLSSSNVSRFIAKLREDGRSEATIGMYARHLKAALRWAVGVGLMHECPKVIVPRRARQQKVMKGRPITGEEFERMLDATPKVVGDDRAESWQQFLRGLWWSGLRLGEALELWWDREDRLHVDLAGKYPMLRIPAALDKGHQDRVLPVAPEFAEFLLATPVEERTGRVFKPFCRYGKPLTKPRVGVAVCLIGKAAGVKVNTHAETGKVKFASAHDLRRSFGERWAVRVMPQVLKELMRHESIETTLRYYVGRNAMTTAEALYAAMGNFSGNTAQKTPTVTHEVFDHR